MLAYSGSSQFIRYEFKASKSWQPNMRCKVLKFPGLWKNNIPPLPTPEPSPQQPTQLVVQHPRFSYHIIIIYGEFKIQASHAATRKPLRGAQVHEQYTRSLGVPTLPALRHSPKLPFPTWEGVHDIAKI